MRNDDLILRLNAPLGKPQKRPRDKESETAARDSKFRQEKRGRAEPREQGARDRPNWVSRDERVKSNEVRMENKKSWSLKFSQSRHGLGADASLPPIPVPLLGPPPPMPVLIAPPPFDAHALPPFDTHALPLGAIPPFIIGPAIGLMHGGPPPPHMLEVPLPLPILIPPPSGSSFDIPIKFSQAWTDPSECLPRGSRRSPLPPPVAPRGLGPGHSALPECTIVPRGLGPGPKPEPRRGPGPGPRVSPAADIGGHPCFIIRPRTGHRTVHGDGYNNARNHMDDDSGVSSGRGWVDRRPRTGTREEDIGERPGLLQSKGYGRGDNAVRQGISRDYDLDLSWKFDDMGRLEVRQKDAKDGSMARTGKPSDRQPDGGIGSREESAVKREYSNHRSRYRYVDKDSWRQDRQVAPIHRGSIKYSRGEASFRPSISVSIGREDAAEDNGRGRRFESKPRRRSAIFEEASDELMEIDGISHHRVSAARFIGTEGEHGRDHQAFSAPPRQTTREIEAAVHTSLDVLKEMVTRGYISQAVCDQLERKERPPDAVLVLIRNVLNEWRNLPAPQPE